MAKEQKKELEIRCPEALANGVYSNVGMVTVNNEEFVLDFIFLHPNANTGDVRSRVVLHPSHAKRLADTLHQHLEKYQDEYGDLEANDSDGIPPITLNLN